MPANIVPSWGAGCRAPTLYWANCEHHTLLAGEQREETEYLLPGKIFFVQQAHAILCILITDHLRTSFHPVPEQLSTRIAGRKAHVAIVADTLGLSGIRGAVNV